MEDKYIVALEIGSSKIKGAIGTVDASGTLSVKTVEEERLIDSVRYGCILNVLETATAIRTVLNRLEQREPQRKITGVYVAVGGRSLMSQEIEIERSLSSEMEITNALINDITDEALSNQLHERTIVGVSPKEFRVDNFPAPRVVGMFGSHISARLNLISCRDQLMRKLNMVLDERLHITINDLFVRPLAEADLVLYPEEKRQGCMFVDCGADTTTVAIYKNGVLMYLSTIPMGSRHITRDITALNILEERAEDLKIQGGNALTNSDSSNMVHNVAGVDFVQINNYVAARAGEIVANVNEQIKYAGLSPDKLPGGIILVGRGAKLNGFDRRLANITTMNVRFGSPTNRIRILDGRLNGSDHVDVISILAAAAKEKNVCECMERIMPEYSYASASQHQPVQPVSEPAQPYQQPAYQQPQQPQPAQYQPAYQPQPVSQPAPAPYQQPQQQPYQQPVQQPVQQPQYQPVQQPQPIPQPAPYQPAYQPAQPQYQQPQQPIPQQPMTGGYPYQAGQQPYQAPQTPDNPYRTQARNITAAEAPAKPAAEQQQSRNWFSRKLGALRDRAVSLMTEPVEDDDPDNDN
ncbi:cell division FtsA domain-containing protein [uncultured Duncaniella sp.]|jgi:cell division protein FtsA|uniref:cell division FtsA domain-containing protein n=1 Tax=uncultured Duncaniella sp. TaxID=2768039 RepID=UPI0025B070FA|nr:cell division FtsA domain-containing protein [uncultured Duncaniella sp.]